MVVKVGKRDALTDAHGRAVAADLRAGYAAIQTRSGTLPPEMIGGPRQTGRGVDRTVQRNEDGSLRRANNNRMPGCNSIMLRREMVRRGLADPRFVTVARASWINKESGVSQPPLKPGAQGVEIVSHNEVAKVNATHQQDEQGFNDQKQWVDRKKGEDVFDKDGNHVQVVLEGRNRQGETYEVFHSSEVNVADLGPRVAPGAAEVNGELTGRAKRWMEANGADKPDAQAIQLEMIGNKLDAMTDNLERRHGVEIARDARVSEATFSIGKDGSMKLSIPKPDQFEDLSHQVTSVSIAVAHAHLGATAQRIAARGREEGGTPNPEAEARVKAYQLPPSKRESSPAYQDAELVATYAAVDTVTGLDLEFRPPESLQNDKKIERWANTLETPGGFADVGRQVGHASIAAAQRPPRAQANPAERGHARVAPGMAASDIAARAASAARQEMRTGGDPSIRQPDARPAAPGTDAGSGREQKQEQAR